MRRRRTVDANARNMRHYADVAEHFTNPADTWPQAPMANSRSAATMQWSRGGRYPNVAVIAVSKYGQ